MKLNSILLLYYVEKLNTEEIENFIIQRPVELCESIYSKEKLFISQKITIETVEKILYSPGSTRESSCIHCQCTKENRNVYKVSLHKREKCMEVKK